MPVDKVLVHANCRNHYTNARSGRLCKMKAILTKSNKSLILQILQASVRQLATAFSPMSKRHEDLSSEGNKMLEDLAGILWDEVPNCSFVKLVDTKPMPQSVKPACPETLVSFARSVDTSSGTTIDDQIDELIMNSSLSDEECEALEVATRLQPACPEWRDHRSGRITASSRDSVVPLT